MSQRYLLRISTVLTVSLLLSSSFSAHAFPTGYTIGKRAAVNTSPEDGNVATEATFGSNSGGYLTSENNLYFADYDYHTIRLYNGTSKNVTTIAGHHDRAFTDGAPQLATFNNPFATVVLKDPITSKDVVIVSDQGNACIRKVPVDGSNVSTLYGVCNSGNATLLDRPGDVGVDNNKLFVVDTGNGRILSVDVGTGEPTVVIQKKNWRPVYLAIANGTFAFVTTDTFKLTTANFATGEIKDLDLTSNISSFTNYSEVYSDPTTWEKEKILYFISRDSRDPSTLIHSLHTFNYGESYDRHFGRPGEFKNHLDFSQSIKDGEDPEFRLVTGMIALSIHEVMIRQEDALRGVFLVPPATNTATMTMAATPTATEIRTPTVSLTASVLPTSTFLVTLNLTKIMGYPISFSAPLTSTFEDQLHTSVNKDILDHLATLGYGTPSQPGTVDPDSSIFDVGHLVLTPPDIIEFNVTVRRIFDHERVQNDTMFNPWDSLKSTITTANRVVVEGVHFCRSSACQWSFSMVGLAVLFILAALILLILLLTAWGRTLLFNCLLLYPILL